VVCRIKAAKRFKTKNYNKKEAAEMDGGPACHIDKRSHEKANVCTAVSGNQRQILFSAFSGCSAGIFVG
jgi:hypothetical protein